MTLPPLSPPQEVGGPDGYSYGAVYVSSDDRPSVGDALRTIGFSGWIAPPQDGWIVAVGDPGAGITASAGRGIVEVGAHLASSFTPILAVRVRIDRQLGVVAWQAGDEMIRYSSDPSQEPDADKEVMTEPVGEEGAEALASALERPDAAEALAELLGEELDTDSVYESERLRSVLRMLGLPEWVIAAESLPRRVPGGPSGAEFIRLRAGREGFAGWLMSRFTRRSRPAPPIITDPPRQHLSGWELGLY